MGRRLDKEPGDGVLWRHPLLGAGFGDKGSVVYRLVLRENKYGVAAEMATPLIYSAKSVEELLGWRS